MTTKELFDLNLKEIKIDKKAKIKYINTLEEQIESDILLEKITQEQKKKSVFVKRPVDEFKEIGDEEYSKEFVKSITGITNWWIVRTDDSFKVMPPIYGKEIPIIKIPTYSKKVDSFDFEFNEKTDKELKDLRW